MQTYTFQGMIKRPPGLSVASKYTVEGSWYNPNSGITTRSTFNINSDVTIPVFNTRGAPKEKTLDITWSDAMQFVGYDTFTGSIGDGRIYIVTGKGIVCKGQIEGGPEDGATFVGAGTWLSS